MNHQKASPRSICPKLLSFFVLTGLANFAEGQLPLLSPAEPSIGLYLFQSGLYPSAPFSTSQSVSGVFGAGTLSLSSTPTSVGTITLAGTVLGGLNPSASSTTTADFNSGVSGEPITDAISNIFYSMEISGPVTTTVPIDVVGALSDSWSPNLDSGGFSDSAGIAILNPDSSVADIWQIADGMGTSGGQTLGIDQTITLTSNTVYYVDLNATTVLEAYLPNPPDIPPGDYSLSANVDPMFTIAPTFALTNPGYSIEYSPNLVPDTPHTLGLLLLSVVSVAVFYSRTKALATL